MDTTATAQGAFSPVGLTNPKPQTGSTSWHQTLSACAAAMVASPPALAATDSSADPAWVIAAVAGWAIALALVVLLLIRQRHWRLAFESKEWLLLPSDAGTELVTGLSGLSTMVSNTAHQVAQRASDAARSADQAAAAAQGAREEFRILRDELDLRQHEIRQMRTGLDFHFRRPVLLRVIRAMEIVEEDGAAGRDPGTTLAGVRIELEECLQDNRISTVRPLEGQQVSDIPWFDSATASRVSTDEDALRGTVAAVNRPAYVVTSPSGNQDVLVPPRVAVYV